MVRPDNWSCEYRVLPLVLAQKGDEEEQEEENQGEDNERLIETKPVCDQRTSKESNLFNHTSGAGVTACLWRLAGRSGRFEPSVEVNSLQGLPAPDAGGSSAGIGSRVEAFSIYESSNE
ncbi:hypothetical protein R1sor_006162 [Riccia sorocarpa]|uniref:Uncharacterized protein n=1 Tax=Riccia sorocarpa TaxID=122646 RepID=A0ABD3HNX0_9MARC